MDFGMGQRVVVTGPGHNDWNLTDLKGGETGVIVETHYSNSYRVAFDKPTSKLWKTWWVTYDMIALESGSPW